MRKALIAILAIFPGLVQAETVIAAFGDSLTQGYGLPRSEGFVPQLQRWLSARGADARVVNAGVSGDTTANARARVEWTLTPDTDAMIVALGGNDLLRGLDPQQARGNLAAILDAAQAADVEVLLIGMHAPGNYGPAYKNSFDAIYPDLAAEYGTLYLPSFFTGVTGGDTAPDLARLGQWLQPDGIHPNAEGVARIVDGIGPSVLALIDAAQD